MALAGGAGAAGRESAAVRDDVERGGLPRLHVRVQKLFVYVRRDQIPPFRFPERMHIVHAKCSSQTRLDDVRALTTNPIGSVDCPNDYVSDSDEDS